MSLVWHMVRKDLRRLGWPLGAWLALILAQTLLVVSDPGTMRVNVTAYEGFSYFTTTWGVIIGAVGFILAAWLVMEDSLVGTQAFWRTRPIHGARLLAAKSLGAVVMFGVFPVAVLTPVWLACGFSIGEWAWSASDLVVQNAIISLAAFALACVTATSGQFLVRWVGAAVLLSTYFSYVQGAFSQANGETGMGVMESRFWLLVALLFLSPLAMLLHQFLTRRTGRSAAILGVGLLLMLPVKWMWNWDISPLVLKFASRNQAQAATVDPEVKFEVKNTWAGEITGVPAGAYLRLDSARGTFWLKDRTESEVRFKIVAGRLEGPPSQAVWVAAGLSAPSAEPRTWAIESSWRPNWDRAQAELHASLMRGRLLGELPLRLGAELQTGSSLTQIAAIERVDGKVIVLLRERDAWPSPKVGMYSNRYNSSLRNTRPAADGFVLLNRARAFAQLPEVTDIGTAQANSVMVGRRELILTPPTRLVDGKEQEVPGWEEGAVIVKVRFVPDHPLVRIITH